MASVQSLQQRTAQVAAAAKLKVRVAFGLFEAASDVLNAAHRLSRAGVPKERLSLVFIPPEACFEDADTAKRELNKVARVIASDPATPPYRWMAEALGCEEVSGSSSTISAARKLAGKGDEPLHKWSDERPAQQLKEFLLHGGGLLIVRLTSDLEQQAVCSTLLHHASSGVQTHEIRRH